MLLLLILHTEPEIPCDKRFFRWLNRRLRLFHKKLVEDIFLSFRILLAAESGPHIGGGLVVAGVVVRSQVKRGREVVRCLLAVLFLADSTPRTRHEVVTIVRWFLVHLADQIFSLVFPKAPIKVGICIVVWLLFGKGKGVVESVLLLGSLFRRRRRGGLGAPCTPRVLFLLGFRLLLDLFYSLLLLVLLANAAKIPGIISRLRLGSGVVVVVVKTEIIVCGSPKVRTEIEAGGCGLLLSFRAETPGVVPTKI